ncbi:MAG: DUF2271 domain-containing protein [Spirochaetae bacterium HGW-Spirochaetae-8]|jgi:hypothetical protein|nr:MAG: DUF2271 domain-containing protein [Spirochaetae bacterium HGW-Spirochaetae-8]
MKMKHVLLLAGIFFLIAGGSVFGAQDSVGGVDVGFNLELKPGTAYTGRGGWFVFSYKVYPQIALWLETPAGEYVCTLYVTAKGETRKWAAAPKEGRPEALPVWYHVQNESADAVSAATSKGAATLGHTFHIIPGIYVVKLETNRSYDYNATYTKSDSGVNGQPSLVYQALVSLGSGSVKADLLPIGTGAIDGSDGRIRMGLNGLDTALELFESLELNFF